MNLRKVVIFAASFLIIAIAVTSCASTNKKDKEKKADKPADSVVAVDQPVWKYGETEILIKSFLGNDQRRFYGRGTPKGLNVLGSFHLGSGQTIVGPITKSWSGAGWTGQPTLIRENGKLFLFQGSNSYKLRKIDLETMKEVWAYKYDDVIKGTNTLYFDTTADADNKLVVMCGSRSGFGIPVYSDMACPSFRAVSAKTGKELWRLNVTRTLCYSRDNDGSAIDLGNGMIFDGAENGIGYFLSSHVKDKATLDNLIQPKIVSTVKLYDDVDNNIHHGNLVTEASPARLGNMVYMASGSGHIYGINIDTRAITFDFFTGTDIDGTTSISQDGFLFCGIERQYCPGNGGVFKLNPKKSAAESVEWFFPTQNVHVAEWEGGVLGSVTLNDEYRTEDLPALWASNSIDGHLYIGSQNNVTGEKVFDPQMKKKWDTPVIAAKEYVGASISTPIFTDGNRIVAATYNGVFLLEITYTKVSAKEKNTVTNSKGEHFKIGLKKLAHFKAGTSFEATPIVWDGKIYICCRDGYMYKLG